MFKLLFKYIIPLGLMLTAFLVGYNYFFGTPTEQENSRQIIAKVRGLGSDVFGLLSSEKQKFSAGKYDNAMEKIGSSLSYLKQQASTLAGGGRQFLDALNAMEYEKQQLQQQLNFLKQNPAPEVQNDGYGQMPDRQRVAGFPNIEQVQQQINDLARRTEEIGLVIGGG